MIIKINILYRFMNKLHDLVLKIAYFVKNLCEEGSGFRRIELFSDSAPELNPQLRENRKLSLALRRAHEQVVIMLTIFFEIVLIF